MKRTLLLLLLSHLSFTSLTAQIIKPDTLSTWRKKLVFNVNLNQASFSSNWKAGGINSIGLNSLFNYKANYTKGRITWDNEIDLLYGFVNNSGQGFRKTIDRMFFDTKYGYELNNNWHLFTSLNFLSQFTKGYGYEKDANGIEQQLLVSDIVAPAFITSAWGLEYQPADYFNLRLSPFAPRITIVNDPERFVNTVGLEPYGVTPPDETRFEWLAFQLLVDFNKDVTESLNLKWRYVLYANYETIKPKTIDHRVDINLSAKVSRFIHVGLGGILIYDYDQDAGAQLSQVFNIGFAYSFQNYEEEKNKKSK